MVISPEATPSTKSTNAASTSSDGLPSTISPALKSIHSGLLDARVLFVDIFAVGTNVPNGVPRPVVKRTIWHPAAARALEATRSLLGTLSRLSHFVLINQKTTAVRIIPVEGKDVGDTVEFGGLLGYAPVMPVNGYSCEAFIKRPGRIRAPIHSFNN